MGSFPSASRYDAYHTSCPLRDCRCKPDMPTTAYINSTTLLNPLHHHTNHHHPPAPSLCPARSQLHGGCWRKIDYFCDGLLEAQIVSMRYGAWLRRGARTRARGDESEGDTAPPPACHQPHPPAPSLCPARSQLHGGCWRKIEYFCDGLLEAQIIGMRYGAWLRRGAHTSEGRRGRG